jgi:hypothetical protein
LHSVEEEEVVALVVGECGAGEEVGVVGVAGGADARVVVERGDFEAGVIGKDELAG